MRNKIVILVLFVAAVMSLALVGCAKPAAGPASAPSPAPEQEVITWKVQDSYPAAMPSHMFAEKLCAAVTEASGGRLVWESYSGGSIVPATKEFDGVDNNSIQASYGCPMFNLDKWSTAGLFSGRPGALRSMPMRVWYEYYGTDLLNEMIEDYNVLALHGVCPQTPEIFAHSNVPLRTVEDFEGLKIRAAGDGGSILSRMGASVIFLAGGEVYEAMERGVIDAFEFAAPSIDWPLSFHEVAKYVVYSEVRVPCDPTVFWVNEQRWEELPPDLKQIVQDEVQMWTMANHVWMIHEDPMATQNFIDHGCEVYHLPKEVEVEMLRVAKEFYDEQAAKNGEFYSRVLESQREFAKAYADNEALAAAYVTF